MIYKFTYQTRGFDLWRLAMYRMYSSMVGVTNIIFTVAMLLLAVKFWHDVNIFVKGLLILAICLFTLIQPLAIYRRANKQVGKTPKEIEIGFNDKGVHVQSGDQKSYLKWKSIKGISKKANMIIIFSTDKHGFILSNRVLGKEREAFYDYVVSRIQNN